MIAATIRTGAPNTIEKIIPIIGMAMRAPSSTSKSPSEWLRRLVLERVTLKCRFNFFETLRSIESSSSGVALTAGEMLAPALALAAALAEIDGEGAGVGDCPNAVKMSAVE